MIMPDVLIVENYRTMSALGLLDTIPAIAPAVLSPRPSASSCCARPSRPCRRSSTTPRASRARAPLQVLLKVYVPLARPIYLAYGAGLGSYHWNNFLWPLIVTNSVEARPLTVGLQVFSSADQGIDWSIITRRDADDVGAAAGRLPAVPAPVRAELHAGGNTVGPLRASKLHSQLR